MKLGRIKINQLYLIAMEIFMFAFLCVNSLRWISPISGYARILGSVMKASILLLLCGLFLYRFIKKPELFFFASIVVMAILYYSYRISGDERILWTGFFVLLSKFTVSFKDIIKKFSKMMGICLAFTFVMNLLGLTERYSVQFPYGIGYSLGTSHPNVLGMMILSFVLSCSYTYLEGRTLLSTALSFIAAIFILFVTRSRTSAYLLVLFAIMLLLRYFAMRTKIEWVLKTTRFAIFVSGIVSVVFMINPELTRDTTSNFTIRFIQARLAFQQYGINLWGNYIQYISDTGYTLLILDNGYLRLLIQHGLIVTLLFIVISAINLRRTIKRKDYLLLIIILIFYLHGISEKFIYWSYMNFTLLGVLAVYPEADNHTSK